jgi:hypothetical protein
MGHGRYSILISWWFINLVASFLSPQLCAQLLHHERLELSLGKNENPYDVLPAHQSGLVLHRLLDESSPAPQLHLILVDTSFNQKWSGTVPVEKRYQLGKKTGNDSKSFFLFHHKEFASINFLVYEIDLAEGKFAKYVIRNYIPFLPTHFEVTNRGALIGGYFMGRIPVILFFEFDVLRSKVLPGLFNEPGELIQIKCHEDASFDILISAKNFEKQKTLWVKSYTAGGDLVQNAILKPQENSSLLFGRTITAAKQHQIIAGVYGQRNSEYSRGLFLAHMWPDETPELFYYPFADLENFFQFMKAKRERRIKERIARKKIKGRKIRFQYRFLVHELIQYKDEYILLGEAFYPKYRTVEGTYAMGIGARGQQTVFDGYQYTHAIIIGFDEIGKLLWDNSFEINDVRSFELQQFVKMDVQDEKIALLYLHNNRIRSKIIQDNTVLEGKAFSELKPSLDETLSRDETGFNKLDYWYDNKFLAYGVQQTGQRRIGRPATQVFFIYKLSYR